MILQGTKQVSGNSTAQVSIDLRLDALVESEESFEIIVSESALNYSEIQSAAPAATISIQDTTTASIVAQASSAYTTVDEVIEDYDLPGGGSLAPSQFKWRSVSASDSFYVAPDVAVLKKSNGSNELYFELAIKDSSGIFRQEYLSQKVRPGGITFDDLLVHEATIDADGNIYAIVTGDKDEYTSVSQQRDFLIKISRASGETLFAKDLSESNSVRTFSALYSDGAGGVIVGSYADEPYPMPRIDRYNTETGDLLWSERPFWGMYSGSIRMSERPIQFLADGTFLLSISGYVDIEDPAYSTYIARVNLDSGTSTHLLGIDGDNTYFQNEFTENGSQLYYRTKFGVYEIDAGANAKVFSYPSSSYVAPSSSGGVGGESSPGGSGGSGGGSGSVTLPATTTAEPPATPPTPPSGNDSDSIGGGSGRVAESTVLGIQPQETVTTVELATPLTLGNLQVTQAVVGTPQNDVITGSDAGEALAGGVGKDQMTGGGGPDAFLFETPGEFGKKSRDTVTDFDPDEGDKVVISRDAFDGVKKVKLDVANGKKDAKNAASSNNTFIYDERKGMLYFNENGKKDGFGDGGEFVKLLGSPEISKGDFAII